MKTSHTLNTPAPSANRAHTLLAIVGIMAAIACTLILLQETSVLPHVKMSNLNTPSLSKLTTLIQTAASSQF